MKAVCWMGVHKVSVERVPDPSILSPRDVILKVTATTICGSDLHLYDGYVPTMREGDVIGHEFMGEIVEVGTAVTNLRRGDRVVVPSIIGCGGCSYCENKLWSLCDNSNPKPQLLEKLWGASPAGIYGYSHAFGGYAGSWAEYIRVPFADVCAFKVPDGVPDEQALFVSDAFPTGYMGAEFCEIRPGHTVAVWGCGGVGLFAIKSAYVLGAARVIAIDRFPERLRLAREWGGAEVLNYEEVDVLEALRDMTAGRGPDACLDAVGLEAHGTGPQYWYDKAKTLARLETDRILVVRQMIHACRKGGVLSLVGVYGGLVDKFPLGPLMNKGLTLRGAQQHGQRYAPGLLRLIADGTVNPAPIVTHRTGLEGVPEAFEMFRRKRDAMVRPLILPHVPAAVQPAHEEEAALAHAG